MVYGTNSGYYDAQQYRCSAAVAPVALKKGPLKIIGYVSNSPGVLLFVLAFESGAQDSRELLGCEGGGRSARALFGTRVQSIV